MNSSNEPARPGIAQSSRWVLAGTVVVKPLQLATNVILARILDPAGFGLLNLANTTAVTIGGVAGLGLPDAANKFMAENFRRDRATAIQIASLIVWAAISIGIVFFLGAWFAREAWAPGVFHGPPDNLVLGLCLVLAFTNLLLSLCINLFTGIQSFREVTRLAVLQAIVVFVAALPLGVIYRVPGALLGSALGSLVCISWALTRLIRIEPHLLAIPRTLPGNKIGAIWHISFPAWLALFVINPVNLFTFSYLASLGGTEQLGIFNTANGFKMLVAMLPGLIGTAIGPAILEEAGKHGRAPALAALLENASAALAFLTVPLTILLLFLSDVIFRIYGQKYAGSSDLFMPLAAGVAANVLCTPLQFVLVARNQNWWLLGFTIAKSLILLAASAWWIPDAMSAGLAWASFAAELAFAVLVVEFCVRSQRASRSSAGFFYRYLAVTVSALAVGILASQIWRWSLAFPLALLSALAIIRHHPAVAVWIAGAIPGRLGSAVHRVLTAVARRATP